MKTYTYEINFLVSVKAENEDKSLEALEKKFPRHDGLVTFANIDGDEIYFTLFEVKDVDGKKLTSSFREEE